MSAAAPVDTKTPNMKPGMGLKFLRDSVDSANLVAMFSVDGQDSLNWFENDWNNHIPDSKDLTLKPLELRFKTATEWIATVGLSDWAAFDQAGVAVDPVFPFNLRFEPTGEFSFPSDTYDVPFEEYLTTIPAGSVLFNIYAMDKPVELGGQETKIAQLKTNSKMVTSYWGDEHMFFRHQLMDDDLKLRPEWEPYTLNPKVFSTISQAVSDTIWSTACPFLNFFQ